MPASKDIPTYPFKVTLLQSSSHMVTEEHMIIWELH